MLRNAAVDHYRHDRRQRALVQGLLPAQLAAPPADAAQILAARQELAQMEAALAALPERIRHVFLMNRAHGCSYDEIAAALGLSYSTVERDIARALLACRQAIGGQP